MVCDDNEDLYSVDYSTSCTEAVEIDYPGKGSFNGVEIVGSCNGLLCIHTDFFDVIWNPCTNEYKKLPIAPAVAESIEDWESHITYGFGYDSTVDDYKVVKVAFLHSGFDYEELDDDKNNEILGSVVERLNWLATKKASSDVPTLIVSFDFVAEQFHEVPHPKCVCSIMDARVLGGQLCILYRPSGGGADMWVMKDYGVIDSWNCLFTIPLLTEVEQPMMRILSFSKIGKLLLEYDHEDLVLYYPELEQYEVLQICGFPEWFKAEAYVGSLVSLKSGTYVEQKQAKKNAINAGDEHELLWQSEIVYDYGV
ncbi:hypothetical protein IFM89_003932 [Coptis chinensis]|uniref:F-box associated beta-propeller type 1 domain-containing protein n=1 Tax=Coptis chinensis TaxID=261450 RepID=A0A835HQZ7_9MAGN|nr:hypothetical protein IFM89_003932 [Coptis chinensis]